MCSAGFFSLFKLTCCVCADGKLYHVRVESHTVFCYYLHDDWRSVVFEQVSTYDVNGVKGYGIFEFLYRSVICVLSFFYQFQPAVISVAILLRQSITIHHQSSSSSVHCRVTTLDNLFTRTCTMDRLHKSAGGMLLLSLRIWLIHRLLGRPGRRLQP